MSLDDAYSDTIFFKDGQSELATTWADHWRLIFDGWNPGSPVPDNPPSATPAFMSDVEEAVATEADSRGAKDLELEDAIDAVADSLTDLEETLPATYAPLRVPEVENPAGLDRFRSAAARAFFERISAICEGDSITQGAYANEAAGTSVAQAQRWADGGWVGQLRKRLSQIFGDLGEGIVTMAAEEGRWTFTGTNAAKVVGVASSGRRWTGAGTATGSFTGTGFDVIGVRRNRGVGSGQPLDKGGVPLLSIDGVDVTPNAIGTPNPAGTAAMTAGWVAGASSSITYTTEGGENVIEKTSSAAAGTSLATSFTNGARFPVTAGQVYLATIEVKPIGAAAAHNHQAGARFYDAANVQIGAELLSTSGAIPADVYSPVTGVITAPAGAVTATFMHRHSSLAASQVHRFRRAKLIPLQWSQAAAGDGDTGSATDATLYRYGIDGQTNAAHTVLLTMAGTGTATTDVTGIRVRKGLTTDPGIVVHREGKSGTATIEHTGSGWSTGTKTDLLALTYEAVASNIRLVVIALGANDYNRQTSSGITPTTYGTNLQILIDKAVAQGASVLLVAGPRWSDDSKPFNQQAYYDVAKAKATGHVAFIDLKDTWGDYASASAKGFMYDSPHPNLSGQGDYARQVLAVLGFGAYA